MPKYKFSYHQLSEAYHAASFGRLTPTAMLMSPATMAQFRTYATDENEYREWDYVSRFMGAAIDVSRDLPDGVVVFIGGATTVKLERECDPILK